MLLLPLQTGIPPRLPWPLIMATDPQPPLASEPHLSQHPRGAESGSSLLGSFLSGAAKSKTERRLGAEQKVAHEDLMKTLILIQLHLTVGRSLSFQRQALPLDRCCL